MPGSSASARRRAARRHRGPGAVPSRSSSAATPSPIGGSRASSRRCRRRAYAAIEIACLDACGKATGRRLCELLGGPVREPVEFAAYLFYRYAADHPTVLADPHLVRRPRAGRPALDAWGEVRSPAAMAAMAGAFRDRWGFRVFKLKGGVLSPDAELRDPGRDGRDASAPRCPLRIDPNGRWRLETAFADRQDPGGPADGILRGPRAGPGRDGRGPPGDRPEDEHEHVRDPVRRTSTEAFQVQPIDVLLCDLHYFGGFAGCLALGPICDAAGWTMSQHSNNHAGVTMAAMIHLGAPCRS